MKISGTSVTGGGGGGGVDGGSSSCSSNSRSTPEKKLKTKFLLRKQPSSEIIN